MVAKEKLGCRDQKVDLEECDDLIFTLSALSEIVAWNGLEILERIYQGTFDEADLRREEIPVEHRHKVKLELLRNHFFGDLISAFQLIDDYEYTCSLMEEHIRSRERSVKEYFEMVLEYQGMCMIYKKRLPWEIEFHLQNIVGHGKFLKQCMASYRSEGETYLECVQRYRSHWQKA